MNVSNRTTQFSFNRRRIRNSLMAMSALGVLSAIVVAQNGNLVHSSFTTGYFLMAAVVFLAMFNLRKKLSFLPAIGTAATWMQLHIYVGFVTILVFGWHISWQFPNGIFESVLAAVFSIVSASGILGLYFTRAYPNRLTGLGKETAFESIPEQRQQIAEDAKSIVLRACESSDVLAKFYSNRLSQFFERPPRLMYLIRPTGKTRRQLVSGIEDLDRYLSEDHRQDGKQLIALVKKRDDLDFHFALQGRLKTWLFVHIGLTYSLLILGLFHAVVVHAFHGGLA